MIRRTSLLLLLLSPALLSGALRAAPALTGARDLARGTSDRAADLLAQTPATPDVLPEVTVTATRILELRTGVPTSTTVLNRSRALERTQTDLAELLRGEVGVFVRATNPSASSPVIRGVTGRDVLLLVDGFRVSNAIFRPNVQYAGYADPYFLERLEVVRGPLSTLYGSDAMGGALNVVTPEFRPGQPGVQLHTDYNSNPAGLSTALQFGFGNAQNWLLGGLTYRSFGDVRVSSAADPRPLFPNPGNLVSGSGYEFFAANLKGRVALAENQSFTLTAQISRIPSVSRLDGVLQGYGASVASAERGFAPQGRTFILGEYQLLKPAAWLDNLRFRLGYQQIQDERYQRNFNAPRPTFPNSGVGTASATSTLERLFSDMIGASVELQSTWDNHRLIYGGEAYFDRVGSERLLRSSASTSTSPDGPRYVDGSTYNQYGLYLQDVIDLQPSLRALLGVRYSLVDLNIPLSTARPASSGFARRFEAVTTSAGLLWQALTDLQLVFNVGTGFRAPNVNDLGNAGERRAIDLSVPNPGLRPETVFSIDGGLRWTGNQFSGELIGFWSRYSDRISDQAVGSLSGGGLVLQATNRDSETIWGIEFGSRYRVDDHWSLFATGTFTQAEPPLFGETVIPPFNGVAGVRFQEGGLYIEPYLRFASFQGRLSVNNLNDPRINPAGTAGFAVLNLRAGLPLTPNTTLRLNLNNLLDSSYREHGTSIDAPGFGFSAGLDTMF